MPTAPLPIDALLPEIDRAVASGNAVLIAPPGAGKTTRVPPHLLAQGIAGDQQILVLEPRRIAARAAAVRVAEELGERVGERCGYEVRLEREVSGKTQILFVTEGVLVRRLAADPTLRGVGVVLIDEFHERHLTGDLALALLRRAQLGPRPDLRIVVMSATFDPGKVAAYLGDCPLLQSEGRAYPVDIEYLPPLGGEALEKTTVRAVSTVARAQGAGHILVFLPGTGEIQRAMTACADLASRLQLEAMPLHGGLPLSEQTRVLTPSVRRKLVFATNVAETSITIEGVCAVIDSGLARVAHHSPWSGLSQLKLQPVSQASCTQRAGRAGRTRPGRCVRLYSQHDFNTRRPHDVPEVMRADLADAALTLAATLGASSQARAHNGTEEFGWFEPPPPQAWAAATALLERLGAILDGALTTCGRRMAQLPIHPRQARMLIEAESLGVAREGCLIAALLGERDVRVARRAGLRSGGHLGEGGGGRAQHTSDSDVLDDLDAVMADDRRALEPAAARSARKLAANLLTFVRLDVPRPSDPDQAMLRSLLAGFPDRVARRRAPGGVELLLAKSAGGGGATLHPASAVHDATWLLAVAAGEGGRGGDQRIAVRTASAIEPDWLLEQFADDIEERDELVFNRSSERVERVRALLFDGLVLDESRTTDPRLIDSVAAGRVLAKAAREGGLEQFLGDPDALAQLRARLAFVASLGLVTDVTPLSDDELEESLAELASGATSFAELRAMNAVGHAMSRRSPDHRHLLDRLAPRSVRIPGRQSVPVHYSEDRPPWIASRMQDFFGLTEGPRIADGRVPLVLELLAPNRRAVQVTGDLTRFWQVHYPELRRQLSRRYPRHAWPDDPTQASPVKQRAAPTGGRRERG